MATPDASKTAHGVAVVAMLGRLGDLSLLKDRPRKDHCAKCGKKIPPGRAGRKCEECRTEGRGT